MTTIKQRRAIKKIVAAELKNHGKKGIKGKAMIEAGYSPATAKNPSNLTKSKGWLELLEQYLPDDKLLAKHDEALEANKVISANITYGEANEKTNDFIEVPDMPTRLKAVELGYKIKKKVGSDTPGVMIQQNFTKVLEDERKEFPL